MNNDSLLNYLPENDKNMLINLSDINVEDEADDEEENGGFFY